MHSDFWHRTQKELSDSAITNFFLFLPTNLYEQGSTALISLKTKTGNSIDAELSLILALSNIHP